jgi:ABC-type cobalamin/Fe3+-siderophores transport system ATPase subunit
MRHSCKTMHSSTLSGGRETRAASPAVAQPKVTPMRIFRIRLVERTTHQGSAEFNVDAETEAAAATIVADAHSAAQALGTNMVTLPDGQTQVVEAETVVARHRAFLLLDDTGADIREIPIIDAPSRPQ